jgi:hypothetical protein
MIGYCRVGAATVPSGHKEETTMYSSNDLLVTALLRERERETLSAAMVSAMLRNAYPAERRRSLREWLGFSLIQAGRALLRHRAAYAVPRRRTA